MRRCRFLHRTAGDTERRYHLRYYKTGICVYDTDARGNCVKNGPHCAFAHGLHDLRSPVYDAKEQQACLSGDAPTASGPEENGGPNSLDKERNALNEDPHWQGEKGDPGSPWGRRCGAIRLSAGFSGKGKSVGCRPTPSRWLLGADRIARFST